MIPRAHSETQLIHTSLRNDAPPSRYFPAVYYLANSKISVALLGNLGFALALLLYRLMIKVC